MDRKWKNLRDWVGENKSGKWLTFGRLAAVVEDIEKSHASTSQGRGT